jgi:hypothetical protein
MLVSCATFRQGGGMPTRSFAISFPNHGACTQRSRVVRARIVLACRACPSCSGCNAPVSAEEGAAFVNALFL